MIGHTHPFNRRFIPLTSTWMIWTLVAAPATFANTHSSIRLHDQAAVEGKQILLRDVAELIGQHAQALQNIELATIDSNQQTMTLTLDSVRRVLDKQDINWGKIALSGYATCVVYQTIHSPEPFTAAASPLVTNPHEELGLSTAVTLRQRVIDLIERFADADEEELRITFSENDSKILARSAWEDRYEIQPLSSSALGFIPIVIRQYHDGRLAGTYRITADVSRRYMAVVAKSTIGRHQTFAPGDVEIREVYLASNTEKVISDLSQVIGFVATSVVRRDAVVRNHQIRSPTLVRRGELITVRCISGDLVVKTVGRATEDGGRDQIIQVRNDRTRHRYSVRITGTRSGVAEAPDAGELTAGIHQVTGSNHP